VVVIIILSELQLRGLDSLLWVSLTSSSMKNPISGRTKKAGNAKRLERASVKDSILFFVVFARTMPKDVAGRNRDSSGGGKIFRTRPERLWGPPLPLHWVARVKRPGRGVDQHSPSKC
jgi:hypothetical protein